MAAGGGGYHRRRRISLAAADIIGGGGNGENHIRDDNPTPPKLSTPPKCRRRRTADSRRVESRISVEIVINDSVRKQSLDGWEKPVKRVISDRPISFIRSLLYLKLKVRPLLNVELSLFSSVVFNVSNSFTISPLLMISAFIFHKHFYTYTFKSA